MITTSVAPRGGAALALAALLALGAGCGGPGAPGPDADPAAGAAALDLVRARAADDPAEPYWPHRAAELELAAGDVAAAEASLRDALARDPDYAPSLSLLSKLLGEQGRSAEAVRLLGAARDRAPLPDALTAALALHLDALDRPDAAEELAATLGPGAESVTAYLRLRGDGFLAARDAARAALERDPSATNHNNHGITLLYAGEPEAARKEFLTAARLDPSLPGPWYNLAIVDRFYRFDDESARAHFRRYRELGSADPDGLAEALAVEMAGTGAPTKEETP